jgi:hypothetical protein
VLKTRINKGVGGSFSTHFSYVNLGWLGKQKQFVSVLVVDLCWWLVGEETGDD